MQTTNMDQYSLCQLLRNPLGIAWRPNTQLSAFHGTNRLCESAVGTHHLASGVKCPSD